MISDQAASENIQSAGSNTGAAISAMKSSNFFLMLILNGSMQQLWGMIRALQMVIFYCLLKIPMPAHTFQFFEVCMLFAKQDIFDG